MSARLPIAVALVALAAPLSAQSFLNGFDSVGAPPAFKQILPGLQNGPEVDASGAHYSGGVILDDLLFGQSATSGGSILATCDTCVLGDMAQTMLPGEITITFADTRDQVDLDVINGFGGGGADFHVTGFDAQGAELGSASVFVSAAGSAGAVKSLSLRTPGMASAVVGTDLAQGYTFAIDSVEHRSYESVFVDLGHALAGEYGPAKLSAFGSLERGEPFDLKLTKGTPGLSIPILGTSAINAPFKQGVMVPAPDFILHAIPVDLQGKLDVSFSFPDGVPAGFTFYLQFWMADGDAPADYAASNGLACTTPPG